MTKIKAVIIEDELPAARFFVSLLSELRPEWSIEILSGTVKAAVERFTQSPEPDLLFLDIHLSDGNAFQFIEKTEPKCAVIFTTAYDQYALRAFEVNSIDYLLKPIRRNQLEAAIEKFEQRIKLPAANHIGVSISLNDLLESIKQPTSYRQRFVISGKDRFFPVSVNEIAYFYSVNRITFGITHSSIEHVIDFSLDNLTSQLDPSKFYRANRQYIVGIDAIRKVETYLHGKAIIRVDPPSHDIITVSRDRVPEFREWMNQ